MEAEARPEVLPEVEEGLAIKDEGLLGGQDGEEEGEEVSVLGEGIEGIILISRGPAFVGEDHNLYQARPCDKRRFVYGENTRDYFFPTKAFS